MLRVVRRIRELLDVDTSGAAPGDALVLDVDGETWVPGAGGGGGGSDDQTAAEVPFTPAGNIAATNVQTALAELDTEKAATVHVHAGDDITSGTVADARIASTIARDSEVSAAIAAHEAAGDPHPVYVTGAEATTAILAALNAADGAGLADDGSGVLSVNVDGSTLEISADALRVKDGGITIAKLSFDPATQAELDAHVNDTSAAHAASAISADSTTLVGTGTDVQAVLEELDNGIADHLADASDAHDASAISVADAGSRFTGTEVEAVLAEIFDALGGGSLWTNSFTESGSSLANWTQDSGSWSVVSAALHVDTTGGTAARLKFNTAQGARQGSIWVLSADVMMESSGVGSDAPLGFILWWDGSGSGNPAVQLFKAGGGAGTKQVRGELDQTAAMLSAFTPATTWAFDAYSNLKVVGHSNKVSILLDGILIASMGFNNSNSLAQSLTYDPFIGLIANNCKANFKNIALDYLALP